MQIIILYANKESVISSSPFYMPLISFSCFIALARIFNTMLKCIGSGGSEHPCLGLRLREKVFSLLSLNMMLAVGFL